VAFHFVKSIGFAKISYPSKKKAGESQWQIYLLQRILTTES
jgi:hypothetical protein